MGNRFAENIDLSMGLNASLIQGLYEKKIKNLKKKKILHVYQNIQSFQ